MPKSETQTTRDSLAITLGLNLRRVRLLQNASQTHIATLAEVSVRVLRRLEQGYPVSTTTFLRVIKALGKSSYIDLLQPTVSVNPINTLRAGNPRSRGTNKTRVFTKKELDSYAKIPDNTNPVKYKGF